MEVSSQLNHPTRWHMQRSSAARLVCGGTTGKNLKDVKLERKPWRIGRKKEASIDEQEVGEAHVIREVLIRPGAPHKQTRVVPYGRGQRHRPFTTTSSRPHLIVKLLDDQNELMQA